MRGDRTFYDRIADNVTMPPVDLFSSRAVFVSTLAQEAGHQSGDPDRLDREFGKRFGDDAYAFEELYAEMTSALLGAELGLPTSHMDDHAALYRLVVEGAAQGQPRDHDRRGEGGSRSRVSATRDWTRYLGRIRRTDPFSGMTVPAALPDLGAYRRLVVAFSGGKDSLAALLHLLALGVPTHAIEQHHHDIDGHGPPSWIGRARRDTCARSKPPSCGRSGFSASSYVRTLVHSLILGMTSGLFAIEGIAVVAIIREYLSLSYALACQLAQATVSNRRDTGRSLYTGLGGGVDRPKVVKPSPINEPSANVDLRRFNVRSSPLGWNGGQV